MPYIHSSVPPAKFMTGLAAVEKLKPPPEPPADGAAAAAVPAPKLKPPAAGAAVGAAADPKLKVEAAVEAATGAGAGAGACPKLNNGFEAAEKMTRVAQSMRSSEVSYIPCPHLLQYISSFIHKMQTGKKIHW